MLNRALVHLGRLLPTTTFATAVCAQQAARLTYEGYEHLKEIARFAWAHERTTCPATLGLSARR